MQTARHRREHVHVEYHLRAPWVQLPALTMASPGRQRSQRGIDMHCVGELLRPAILEAKVSLPTTRKTHPDQPHQHPGGYCQIELECSLMYGSTCGLLDRFYRVASLKSLAVASRQLHRPFPVHSNSLASTPAKEYILRLAYPGSNTSFKGAATSFSRGVRIAVKC